MSHMQDPVDRALAHLSAREYPGPAHNERIERAIAEAVTSRRHPRTLLLIAIVAVMLGAGALAASMSGVYARLFSPSPSSPASHGAQPDAGSRQPGATAPDAESEFNPDTAAAGS
jgi:hypothetical protein